MSRLRSNMSRQTTTFTHPGLVLKGEKHDALGAVRGLPDQDQAGGRARIARRGFRHPRRGAVAEFSELRPDKGQWVALETQAQRTIVAQHPLAGRLDRELRGLLGRQLVQTGGGEQGQGSADRQPFHLPQGAPTGQFHGRERVGARQAAQRALVQGRPPPE